MSSRLPILSILCPVYNEEAVVPLFYGRIGPVLDRLAARYRVRLVFLNNASTDTTLAAVRAIMAQRPDVYVISMSRTVDYQASLERGLRTVASDLYVFIDVDCEDPPEMIETFVERFEAGYDIVYGKRVDREEPAPIKRARRLFYRLLQAVADEDVLLDMAEFALFTREVRDAAVDENSSFPFLRTSIARVGFRRAAIPFKRQRRIAGQTHYNLLRMSIFAVAGILASSTLPLRLPVYCLPFWLLALAALGIAYGETESTWYAVWAFLLAAAYLGTTAAATAMYVARTYKNGLIRPNAFIDRANSVLPPPCPAAGRSAGQYLDAAKPTGRAGFPGSNYVLW
jgi:dolichol-phosphate mannosyltransferase